MVIMAESETDDRRALQLLTEAGMFREPEWERSANCREKGGLERHNR